MEDIYKYIGVMHVHTTFSDGQGTIEEVIAAARTVGLDFIVITDHNDISALQYEGWYGHTLLLAGEEVTRPGGNHMLAVGIRELISPEVSPQKGIEIAKAQGATVILAHPFYQGSSLVDDPPLPWCDWSVSGFDGIEVWNLTADLYQILGAQALTHPPKDVLAWATPNPMALRKWDSLLEISPVIGFGGLDAHADRIARWGGIVVLPYEKAFRALRLHMFLREPLTEGFSRARELIQQGLARGTFLISFDYLSDKEEGVFAEVIHREERFLPGESISGGKASPLLRVKLPTKAGVKVICRGEELVYRETRDFSLELKFTGPYRVEIYKGDRLWVLTNPFYRLDETGSNKSSV